MVPRQCIVLNGSTDLDDGGDPIIICKIWVINRPSDFFYAMSLYVYDSLIYNCCACTLQMVSYRLLIDIDFFILVARIKLIHSEPRHFSMVYYR